MNRFKSFLCLYLTVALLLSAAVTVFGIKIPLDLNIENSVSDTFPSEEVFEEAESVSITENASDDSVEMTEGVSELSAFVSTSENGEVTQPHTDEPTSDAVPEDTTADFAGREEETSAPVLSQSICLQPVLYNSYAPGAALETVSSLHIFSDTIGSLASADAVNVYTFTLEKRAMFRYRVAHDEINGVAGWKFSLYEEYLINGTGDEKGYRLIDILNTTAASTLDSSVALGLGDGNYRLVVTKGLAFTADPYRISVELTEGAFYETECNDNIYRYTEVYNSVPVKGSASYFPDRQDEDYYLFRMYSDGFIELKFEHPAKDDKTSVCWQVIFFSEDGTKLYSVNSLFPDTLLKSGTIGLAEGNYYVLVRNRVYTDMTYTLTLTRTSGLGYENEQNDTPETANELSLNSTLTGSVASQLNGIDRDYFKLDVPEDGVLQIEFAHEPSGTDADKNGWNILLLSEDNSVLYKGISAWGDDVVTSSRVGLDKGTYYIRIDSESLYLNSDKYYLTASFDSGQGTETEFNDTFASADVLEAGIPVTGLLAERGIDYDFDCYTFTLDADSDVTISFTHEILSYSKNIFVFTLFDKNGNEIAVYSQDADGKTAVNVASDSEATDAVYKALPAGKYYIKVATGLFFDKIEYQLSYSH